MNELYFTEVELDKFRTWCPKAGCETICLVGPQSDKMVTFQSSSSTVLPPCAVHCPTCRDDFCSGCKKPVSLISDKFRLVILLQLLIYFS